MTHHDIAARLCCGQLLPIHQESLYISSLNFDRRTYEAFDRVGDIVRLINQIGWGEARCFASLGGNKLVEYEKEPERIDGTGVEIIVAIFGIIEVEAREPFCANEAGNDLLNICRGSVMPKIHEALGLGSELVGRHQA